MAWAAERSDWQWNWGTHCVWTIKLCPPKPLCQFERSATHASWTIRFLIMDPGGGGGATHPCLKKTSKGRVFQTSASSLYRTLGAPRNKNIRSKFIQNAILSTITIKLRHLRAYNYDGAIRYLGSILEVDGRGWVAHLCASDPPPPPPRHGQYASLT